MSTNSVSTYTSNDVINDDEMDVYDRPEQFSKFSNDPDFKDAIFYRTFGGGPEGGYVVKPDGSTWEVSRTWGTMFIPRALPVKLAAIAFVHSNATGERVVLITSPAHNVLNVETITTRMETVHWSIRIVTD